MLIFKNRECDECKDSFVPEFLEQTLCDKCLDKKIGDIENMYNITNEKEVNKKW